MASTSSSRRRSVSGSSSTGGVAASTVTSRRSAAGGGRLVRGLARRRKRRILMQYLSLQLLQLRRRVEPLLVREREPRRAVDLERLRLPAAAIERKHQLAAQPVAERVGGDERFQLPDKLGVAAEQELGVEPILEGDDAQLVEARGFVPGELLLVEVCERLDRARARALR